MKTTTSPPEVVERVPALKHAAASGVRWTSLAYVARTALHLLTTAIFAWLLTPADFGLVGMAMVVVGFVTLFKDLGTGAAVVQKKEIDARTLSSIFWANAAIGLVACGLLLLLAPAIAAFYREPRLVGVLRLLGLSLVFSAPGVVCLALLQKRLRFDALARIEIAALIGGAALGLGAAFAGAGVWSLVLMTLTTALLTSGFAFLASRFRPRAVLHPAGLREVAGFSLNLTGFQLVHWLTRNLDQLLIGRFLGATQLGYYALAVRLVLYPLQGVSSVVGRVMFPLFSSIQGDDPRFRNAYLKVTNAIATLLFPALAGLFLVSGSLVEVVLGPKWLPAIPILALFALVGVLQSIGSTAGPIYQAKGRTDLLLKWGLFAGAIWILGVAVGLRWGIVGVAAGFGIVSVGLAWPSLAIPFRLIGLRVATLLQSLARPALATLLMVAATAAFQELMRGSLAPTAHLVCVVLCGVATYVGASLLVNGARTREVVALLARREGTA